MTHIQTRALLQGDRGVFIFFSSEIDVLVVSDKGDLYISDAFGPVKNIVLDNVITTWMSALQCNCIAREIFNRMP